MKKQVKAILLPTKDKTHIFQTNFQHLHYSNNLIGFGLKYQHIYITSDENIEEGDWMVHKYHLNKVKKVKCVLTNSWVDWLKIIATSDDNLFTKEDIIPYTSLSNVSQSFLKAFVESGGKEDWEVECEEIIKCYKCGKLEEDCINTSSNCLGYFEGNDILKLDSNNCIILSAIEEKVYDREEILRRLSNLKEDFEMLEDDRWVPNTRSIQASIDNIDWIKENLL